MRRDLGVMAMIAFAGLGTMIAVSAGAAEALAGRTLVEAFAILAEGGVSVIYSDALITADMTVLEEPVAVEPGDRIAEIVRPWGLSVRKSGDRYFIIPGSIAASAAKQGADSQGAPLQYLEEITVSPGQTTLSGEVPEQKDLLTSDDIEAMPHPGDDLMRAVQSLPGMTSNDVSSQFHVKGGDLDELLILLDGQEIFEPFHLKDFMNLFSMLDTETVRVVDVFAGGFPAEYGDRMSGVMDISIVKPSRTRMEVSVGTLHSRLLLAGSSSNDRGTWLATGRAWYPERLPKSAGYVSNDELQTDYYDGLMRGTWQAGTRSSLFGGALMAYDDISFESIDGDESENVDARYSSEQFWLGHDALWKENLSTRTVFSSSHIDRDRTGGTFSLEDGRLDVRDDRSFEFLMLRHALSWQTRSDQMVKLGFEVRRQQADYAYERVGPQQTIASVLEPHGTSSALWLSDRLRIGENVVAEAGARWDHQTHLKASQFSPRLNVLWQAGNATAVRGSWGRYYQTERLNELQIQDGVVDFADPQSLEQWMIGLEHRFAGGVSVQASAWDKCYRDLRPRWTNLYNPLEIFPEAEQDRIEIAPTGGRSRGAGLVVNGARRPDWLAWWLGYTFSDAFDELDGRNVPRSWNPRHSIDAGLDVLLPRKWRLSLGGRLGTGRPFTTAVIAEQGGELVAVPSEYNGGRLPGYKRLDLRITREITTSKGRGELVLEAINVTNERNVCCVDDYRVADEGGVPRLTKTEKYWSPLLPSLAIRWYF